MVPHDFRIGPLQAVVLMWHLTNSEDAENDADNTVGELVRALDDSGGFVPKGLLESALYCCNMEDERKKFWHPLGMPFDRFVNGILISQSLHFDKYHNVIYEDRNRGKKVQTPKAGQTPTDDVGTSS